MIRILFICHGNICRSPAAEFVFTSLSQKQRFTCEVSSAATTREEIGNDVYPPMRKALIHRGIPMKPHHARQTVRADYAQYDYIIGMDEENLTDLLQIYGGDPEHKVSLLMHWCGEDKEVSDPWYTRNFEKALDDIERGCQGLLSYLVEHA